MKDEFNENTVFQHPRRFPKNAEGAFYTLGTLCKPPEGSDHPPEWCGDCLWCGAPENEAPELFAPFDETYTDTYFKRQPETHEELARAIESSKVCCVDAVRYGGTDRNIITAMGNNPATCDYIIAPDHSLELTVGPDGNLLPFAREMAEAIGAELLRRLKDHRNRPASDSCEH